MVVFKRVPSRGRIVSNRRSTKGKRLLLKFTSLYRKVFNTIVIRLVSSDHDEEAKYDV